MQTLRMKPTMDTQDNEDPAVVAQQQRVNELRLKLDNEVQQAEAAMKQNQAFLEGRINARKTDLDEAEKELAQLKLPKEPAKVDAGLPSDVSAA